MRDLSDSKLRGTNKLNLGVECWQFWDLTTIGLQGYSYFEKIFIFKENIHKTQIYLFLFCCNIHGFFLQKILMQKFFPQLVAKYEWVHNVKRHFVMAFAKNCYFLSAFHKFIKIGVIKPFSFQFFWRDKNWYFPTGGLLKWHCIEFSHFLVGGVDKFCGNDNLSQ